MEFFVNGFEPTVLNMGIKLGCRYIGMSQHELHRTQVGTVFQEMGGEGMPERVGTYLLFYPCLQARIL